MKPACLKLIKGGLKRCPLLVCSLMQALSCTGHHTLTGGRFTLLIFSQHHVYSFVFCENWVALRVFSIAWNNDDFFFFYCTLEIMWCAEYSCYKLHAVGNATIDILNDHLNFLKCKWNWIFLIFFNKWYHSCFGVIKKVDIKMMILFFH